MTVTRNTRLMAHNWREASWTGFKQLCFAFPRGLSLEGFIGSELSRAPFFVSLDHVTQSVVVTIRGSISLRDLFTDFTAGADRFDVEGLPPDTMISESLGLTAEDRKLGGCAARHRATVAKSLGSPSTSHGCRSSPGNQAHKGMIIGANNIKACLDEQKILEKAFTMYPEYNLVISEWNQIIAACSSNENDQQPTFEGFVRMDDDVLVSEELTDNIISEFLAIEQEEEEGCETCEEPLERHYQAPGTVGWLACNGICRFIISSSVSMHSSTPCSGIISLPQSQIPVSVSHLVKRAALYGPCPVLKCIKPGED
uniref:Uncharacterized protein n=1 Tax=Timema monikensis TaxID=170555 RepID=A0A7R9EG32_9NEOP|nr:unnamed protein product [Timema monikensis]